MQATERPGLLHVPRSPFHGCGGKWAASGRVARIGRAIGIPCGGDWFDVGRQLEVEEALEVADVVQRFNRDLVLGMPRFQFIDHHAYVLEDLQARRHSRRQALLRFSRWFSPSKPANALKLRALSRFSSPNMLLRFLNGKFPPPVFYYEQSLEN